MDYYIDGWRKLFIFSGRATRKEFWMFTLFHVLVSIMVSIILTTVFPLMTQTLDFGLSEIMSLDYLISLLLSLPYVSLLVRRSHDSGFSGRWVLAMYLIIPIFFIFSIFLLAPISFNLFMIFWVGLLISTLISLVLTVSVVIRKSAVDNQYGPKKE